MEPDVKVFCSDIMRGHKPLKNNLSDLITLVPAQPISVTNNEKLQDDCNFQPKGDKQYVYKKKSKLKVKTIRDIRNNFEKDIYTDLPSELEKQQNILLRKIRGGHARKDYTKVLAKHMIKCDKPVSRAVWQMLMNLNAERHANPTQYVLWNGKRIRLNGSRGGKSKFICSHDLESKKIPVKGKFYLTKNISKIKKGLLRNSLTIKFKPGPLTKKIYLDDSFQKYHVGGIELVNLPKPGLDIQPTYGVPLESTITNFLHSLRDINGTISEQWAEISVSVLGSIKNNKAVQTRNDCVTIDLNYKRDQRRILMRRDADNTDKEKNIKFDVQPSDYKAYEEHVIFKEVKSVVHDMLNYVEISLEQDNMYTEEEEVGFVLNKESTLDDHVQNTYTQMKDYHTQIRDKTKRKCLELERLDVTVIRLPEHVSLEKEQTCSNSYCLLGCICSSLECSYRLKRHCGRVECMFQCKCDFSKYRVVDSFESDCPEFIPGLLNLDNEMNLKLAKEEQKFHHTVVMTGEKSILLKSRKRNWKSPKKYADFYTNMSLKTRVKPKLELSVSVFKLNCENIEPWCMVHNLYKCFCKGRFTESCIRDIIVDEKNTNETPINQEQVLDVPSEYEKSVEINKKVRLRQKENKESVVSPNVTYNLDDNSESCARIKPYQGRKYSNGYYLNTNKKISEMEMNDSTLRRRMNSIIHKSELMDVDDNLVKEFSSDVMEVSDQEVQIARSELPLLEKTTYQSNLTVMNSSSIRLKNKTKLVSWLESSYKLYKQRIDQGIVKMSLEPPKLGKIALHPWEFILSRYKERKNLFLVTMHSPFRIFMAVDNKNPFFKNCINIDDIRFPDLQKYPLTVKNLLTNATDMKNNFCILCGLSHCWELIGSVTKVSDANENNSENVGTLNNEDKPLDTLLTDKNSDNDNIKSISKDQELNDIEETDIEKRPSSLKLDSDSSKWFVMTVEEDFSEIQFYKRGFFVKYDSILKAINVARISGKTVRLSSQKCIDQHGAPQFGIYAIPNANEYCVFVGPYERDESLGIETVKTLSDIRKHKRTRGVWITTSKIDNLKVIDNPLSFMPPKNVQYNEMLPLDSDIISKTDCNNISAHDSSSGTSKNEKEMTYDMTTKTSVKSPIKVVKPIKIRKTNGFYQLAPNGLLKPISLLKDQEEVKQNNVCTEIPVLLNTSLNKDLTNSNCNVPLLQTLPLVQSNNTLVNTLTLTMKNKTKVSTKKPVAEIAPLVKSVSNSTDNSRSVVESGTTGNKKSSRGMFILKPEEINKRASENKTFFSSDCIDTVNCSECQSDVELDMDIENFLVASVVCASPNNDAYFVSDDRDFRNDTTIENSSKDVWIECKNVDNMGWIKGRRNNDNYLSFEFPGFKSTEFYTEQEAFEKINQVLLRKIYVPKRLKLKWHVIESENDLKSKHMLKSEDLGPDFIMTRQGIRHKRNIKAILDNNKKDEEEKHNTVNERRQNGSKLVDDIEFIDHDSQVNDFEKTSQTLEEEGINLWTKTLSKKSEILDSLQRADSSSRQEMAEQLKSIMSCNCS